MDVAGDAASIAALRQGRADLLAPLCERHTPALYRLAYRLAGEAHAAEDLVQETWIRLLRQPPRLEPGASALPWLRRVLVRLAIDRGRSGARRPAQASGLQVGEELPDPGPAPPEAAMLADQRRRVRDALDRLPPGYRAILVLLHGEGMSVREVAAILTLPESVVKNRAMRGRRRLREIVEAQAHEGEGEVTVDGQAARSPAH